MTDHDQIHKELLKRLLPHFLRAFAPELAAGIDFSTLMFLDYSFVDADEGTQRHVDLLARFELLDPPTELADVPQYVLVHIENQAYPQLIFPRRMLGYFMKIWLSNPNAIIYPIAVYTHDAARPEADSFEIHAFGKEILRFNFQAIQLRRLDWRAFADSRNPVEIAFLANMGRDSADRVERKSTAYHLANELCKAKHPSNEIHLVLSYLDTYLDLDPVESLQFEEEIRTLAVESEPIMEFLTTREKVARKEGIEKGREEGLKQGLETGMRELLDVQFDQHEIRLSKTQRENFEALTEPQLKRAAQLLAKSPESFVIWLEQQEG